MPTSTWNLIPIMIHKLGNNDIYHFISHFGHTFQNYWTDTPFQPSAAVKPSLMYSSVCKAWCKVWTLSSRARSGLIHTILEWRHRRTVTIILIILSMIFRKKCPKWSFVICLVKVKFEIIFKDFWRGCLLSSK